MKARIAYPLIVLAAILGYAVGAVGHTEEQHDADQKARAAYEMEFRRGMAWQLRWQECYEGTDD